VTRAQYHFQIDLGGHLPAWLARKGALRAVANLFRAVRGQVSRVASPQVSRGA
jgi:hypothetical protein